LTPSSIRFHPHFNYPFLCLVEESTILHEGEPAGIIKPRHSVTAKKINTPRFPDEENFPPQRDVKMPEEELAVYKINPKLPDEDRERQEALLIEYRDIASMENLKIKANTV